MEYFFRRQAATFVNKSSCQVLDYDPMNTEKLFRTRSGECACSFQVFSKQLQYYSNAPLQLPLCSPHKTVSIWLIKRMKKTRHKQFLSVSENVYGEVQFS